MRGTSSRPSSHIQRKAYSKLKEWKDEFKDKDAFMVGLIRP